MELRVSDDLQRLDIKYENQREKDQLTASMIKYIRQAHFKCKHKRWKGDVPFLNESGRSAKIGLWLRIKMVCERFNFPFKIYGLKQKVFVDSITLDEVRTFCTELMKDNPEIKIIRDRQIEAVYKLIRFRYCLGSLATSAGKSLIIFMYVMFLRHKKMCNKVLIITRDADAVIQLHSEFIMYANAKFKLRAVMVHGGSSLKDVGDARIIIGNFQTLSNRDSKFFNDVNYLVVDEVQSATNDSIKYIMDTCPMTAGRIGVSGSLKEDDSADIYDLYKSFGPIVCTVKKKELMDSGEATPIDIKIFILDWATKEQRKQICKLKLLGTMSDIEIYHIEQEMIRNSVERLDWIIEFAGHVKGNMLILFNDVKGGYGKKIVDRLKMAYGGREVYYIDGDVKPDMRDSIKKRMESADNAVLVATYPTYGTAKSIKKLHYVLCAESMKGHNIISQGQGRGMRLHDTKDVFYWIDITDDISIFEDEYKNRNNSLRQMDERIKHYKGEGFDFDIKKVKLTVRETKPTMW